MFCYHTTILMESFSIVATVLYNILEWYAESIAFRGGPFLFYSSLCKNMVSHATELLVCDFFTEISQAIPE